VAVVDHKPFLELSIMLVNSDFGGTTHFRQILFMSYINLTRY